MGRGPEKAAAMGMPAISAPRGTPEFRRQIAARDEWVRDQIEFRGQTLESMGVQDREGQARGVWRTYGPGGYFSQYGEGYNTNFIYDWASGRKLNVATNAEKYSGETRQNSQGQWVFDPEKASAERWEKITPEEYQGYQEQQSWNAQNPGRSYADRLAERGFAKQRSWQQYGQDPRTGLYFNDPGNNPAQRMYFDRYGRQVRPQGMPTPQGRPTGASSYAKVAGAPPPQGPPQVKGGFSYGADPTRKTSGTASSYGGASSKMMESRGSGTPPGNEGGGFQGDPGGMGQSGPPAGAAQPGRGAPTGGGGGGGGILPPIGSGGGGGLPPGFGNIVGGVVGGVTGGPAGGPSEMPPGGYGEMPGFGGMPGYGGMSGYGGMGGIDYSGIFGPLMGSEAAINAELLNQARMDSLGQNFWLQDAMNNRAQGQGMENYLKDFYGGILGIGFDPVRTQGISDYMNQGMAGLGGPPQFTPGGVTPGTTQVPGGSYTNYPNPTNAGVSGQGLMPVPPSWLNLMNGESEPGGGGMFGNPGVIPPQQASGPTKPMGGGSQNGESLGGGSPKGDGFWPDPLSGGAPIYEEPPNGMTPEQYQNAQHGFPAGEPSWFTQWTNSGGAPWQYGQGWPGQSGYGGGQVNVPGSQPLPSVPLPSYSNQQGGYRKLEGPAFDVGQRNSWALMAPYAQGVMGDTNAAVERLRRELPEGGQQSQAIAETLRAGQGGIAQGRQQMVTDALSQIGRLADSNKFNTPLPQQSGSGQAMLGAYTSNRNAQIGAGASNYAANLGAQSSRYSTDRQYSLGLQQLKAGQGSPWGALLGTLGQIGAGWASGGFKR